MGVAVAMPRLDSWRGEAPAPVIDHRRFGPMRASFRRDSDAFIWECLDLVQTRSGPADLEFEADAWGPTVAHEQQLETITTDLDTLSEAAAQAIAAAVGEISALEWQGARVTGRTGTFQLHYWCKDAPELLVAVLFEQSLVTGVEMHD
jgi:hypothetical protein